MYAESRRVKDVHGSPKPEELLCADPLGYHSLSYRFYFCLAISGSLAVFELMISSYYWGRLTMFVR